MKKGWVIFCFLLVMGLSSCVDVDETYDFHSDGSCNVTYNFDMGKAISVLVNLMPDSLRQTPQFNLVQDTTINYLSILPDSIRNKMDSSQVAMAKSSDIVLDMNLKHNLVKLSLRHSSDNVNDLNYYLKNVSSFTSDVSLEFIDKSSKKTKPADNGKLVTKEQKAPFALTQDFYNYEVAPHKFYRTIDSEKFKKYVKANQSMFSMSKAMLIDMPYKVTMKFPDPVNKVENKKAVLSADKRSVTLETNIEEVLKNPDVMNFRIDF